MGETRARWNKGRREPGLGGTGGSQGWGELGRINERGELGEVRG